HFVDRAFDGRGRGLDALGPAMHDLEVVAERVDLFWVGVDQLAELPVRGDRELKALVVGDRPQDVRRDGPPDVNVEIGELGLRVDHRGSARYARLGDRQRATSPAT